MLNKNRLICLFIVSILVGMGLVMAATEPDGSLSITISSSTTRNITTVTTLPGLAGNITQMSVSGYSVTQSWAAFVGNVTGVIILQDAKNGTFYDWSQGSPSGEIYATYLTSVTWTAGLVTCWNWSDATGSYLQMSELEEAGGTPSTFDGMGCASTDVDGVDETFNYSETLDGQRNHSSFFVGSQFINGTIDSRSDRQSDGGGGPCANVRLWNGSTHQKLRVGDAATIFDPWEEVILYYEDAGASDGVVFAALLSDDTMGYDNGTWDFQILVPDNGHSGDTTSQTYYFYVELS